MRAANRLLKVRQGDAAAGAVDAVVGACVAVDAIAIEIELQAALAFKGKVVPRIPITPMSKINIRRHFKIK